MFVTIMPMSEDPNVTPAPPVSPPAQSDAGPNAFPHAPVRQYRLFKPTAISLATFLGSPIAGSIVMAINYKRMGRKSTAGKAVALGFLGTVALGALASVLPAGFPAIVPAIAGLAVMGTLAKALQEDEFRAHVAAGGAVASNWRAAGVAVVVSISLLVMIFAGVFLLDTREDFLFDAREDDHRVEFANRQTVVYSGLATESDARTLGTSLQEAGFFGEKKNAKTVLLSRNQSQVVVAFVVQEGAWDKPDVQAAFKTLAGKAARDGLGFPLELELLDQHRVKHWQCDVAH
jgi:hypothetical protein